MQVRLFGELAATRGGVPVAGPRRRSGPCWPSWLRSEVSRSGPDRLIDVLRDDGQATNPANALQAQKRVTVLNC
jgi:hypothetical protein